MSKAMPNLALLRDTLAYEPETGIFRWKRPGKNRNVGKAAGSTRHDGYTAIYVCGERYLAHRLAWYYVYGEDPGPEIDHINGDPHDNRVSNLRCASRIENCSNRSFQSNSRSKVKGVSRCAQTGRWIAFICHSGKRKNLGRYASIDDAAKAYAVAAGALHGQFARVGQ